MKGQNNFRKNIIFQLVPGGFSYLLNENNHNSNCKKNIGIYKHAGKVKKINEFPKRFLVINI